MRRGRGLTRHGDGGRRWNFGFRYEVAYDRAGTATVGTLSLSCAGSANGCGCFDAVSRQYAKPTGWCKHGIAEYAKAETGRLCLTDVAVTVDRVVVDWSATFPLPRKPPLPVHVTTPWKLRLAEDPPPAAAWSASRGFAMRTSPPLISDLSATVAAKSRSRFSDQRASPSAPRKNLSGAPKSSAAASSPA